VTYTPQTWVANTTVVSAARMNYIESGITAAAAGGGGGAWALASSTVLGSAGTFDVTSIAATYNDLALVAIARENTANFSAIPSLTFNGDSGLNYSRMRTQASGSAVAATESINASSFQIGAFPANNAPAGAFGTAEITLHGYASTLWQKSIHFKFFWYTTLGSGGVFVQEGVGVWNSTAAINRVTLVGNGGANFVTGSQLRIYGRT